MDWNMVLNVVVAVLLVAMIVYAALLNRRLQGLRANKAEFEAMVTEFNEATRRTEAAQCNQHFPPARLSAFSNPIK